MTNLRGDDYLAMSVTSSSGLAKRWGPDERDAVDVPDDLTFSTQIPGGFKDLSCSLLRRIDVDYADLALFDDVRVYGPGNRTAWEGRMDRFPRSHGDGFQIVPGAVGWSAHLDDDPTFTEVYVDRDPSHWGDASLNEKIRSAGAPANLNGAMSFATDVGGIVCSIPNQAFPAAAQYAAAWYVGPAGSVISKVMYRGAVTSLPAGWTHGFYFTTTDSIVTFSTVTPTLDDTLRTATPSPTRNQYVGIYLVSASTALTPAAGALVRYSKLGVYGSHGLTTRSISGEPDGVYASDVVQNIVTRNAPLLNIATGAIEATTFAIPHLVFPTPVTGTSAIQLVNGFHGFEWGVYDGREFFYRATDPDRLTWTARLSQGARLDLEGETGDQVFNGVYVTYQDPSGKRKTVGPPGASADDTDATLADTDATNPVNSHGIDRRWAMLEVSEVTTLAGAVQLGSIWLLQQALPQRRGTLTLTGSAEHPLEGDVPTWRVRAGDYVSIADHPADVPRRIIETRYTRGNRQLVCNLDNTPFMLDAILQRFGAGLVGVL
jgi:hypothetical protein